MIYVQKSMEYLGFKFQSAEECVRFGFRCWTLQYFDHRASINIAMEPKLLIFLCLAFVEFET